MCYCNGRTAIQLLYVFLYVFLPDVTPYSPAALAKEPTDDSASISELYDRSRVGPLGDGRVIVPTNQILAPAGRQVIVSGRPTDVALSPDGRWLAVLNLNRVQLVDVESG